MGNFCIIKESVKYKSRNALKVPDHSYNLILILEKRREMKILKSTCFQLGKRLITSAALWKGDGACLEGFVKVHNWEGWNIGF